MEETISRNGHRQRMRNQYLQNGCDGMPDHNILELFLSIVIPRKDVKQVAYDLINEFGSLENIIYANVDDLMNVKGVGETTAIELKLIAEINKRILFNRNNGVKSIKSTSQAIEYCENILREETVEKILMITLNCRSEIISSRILAKGVVNAASATLRDMVSYAVRDNAVSVIVAHNHPGGKPTPSANDLNSTVLLKGTLFKIGINLADSIIVSDYESVSMKSTPQTAKFFNTIQDD